MNMVRKNPLGHDHWSFPSLTGICVLMFALIVGAVPPRIATNPQEIVQAMERQYVTADSYQDVGVVTTTYVETDGLRVESTHFKTYFKRPQYFRFEWIEFPSYSIGQRGGVLWCNGKHTYLYREPDRYEEKENLGVGIAIAVGLSSGTVHTIPRLLMNEVGGFSLIDLKNLVMIRTESIDGETCYVIKGEHPAGSVYELWIGKRDFILRKRRTKTTFVSFSTVVDETHKEIKINKGVPAGIFDFSPPGKKEFVGRK